MPARVLGRDRGNILNLEARRDGAPAKIHVFKPDRMKTLIQATQLLPNIAPDHQKSARRLFHQTRLVEIAVQISIALIDRIRRPQPIQTEDLEQKRSRRGEAADGKPFSAHAPSYPLASPMPVHTGCWRGSIHPQV